MNRLVNLNWIKAAFHPLALLVMFVWVSDTRGASEGELGLIPDVIVSMPEDTGVVVVEKKTQRVMYYEYDGAYRKVHAYKCSTGEKVGAKLLAGDKKTPEGVYLFTTEYPDKYLSPVYGTRALPLDYPNPMDKRAGRTGSAIWLHGTNKKLKDRDSNGCVAMNNSEIDVLARSIELNRTPIIIVDSLGLVPVGSLAKEEKAVDEFLTGWLGSLKSGPYHRYLSFYDPTFLPEIAWWGEWDRLKGEFGKGARELHVSMEKRSIYRHDGIYVVMMDLLLARGAGEVSAGRKKLFLHKSGEGFRIIGEEFRGAEFTGEKERVSFPLLTAARELKARTGGEDSIALLVSRWLSAWSSGDIDSYGEFYAADFKSGGMGRRSWIKYKKRLNRKYDYIDISIDKLVVKKKKTMYDATFVQTYKSSGYSAVGVKRLELKNEGGRWKIYRESWKEN